MSTETEAPTTRTVEVTWFEVTVYTDTIDLRTGEVSRTTERPHAHDVGLEVQMIRRDRYGADVGDVVSEDPEYGFVCDALDRFEAEREAQL